jgi:hypothetical protein
MGHAFGHRCIASYMPWGTCNVVTITHSASRYHEACSASALLPVSPACPPRDERGGAIRTGAGTRRAGTERLEYDKSDG